MHRREELREGSMKSGSPGIKDVMDSIWLGQMFDQGNSSWIELLDSPLLGLDEEAISISRVMQILEMPELNMLSHVVFDSAPTVSESGWLYDKYRLEEMRDKMRKVQDLFRDLDAMKFIIVTIPMSVVWPPEMEPSPATMKFLSDELTCSYLIYRNEICMGLISVQSNTVSLGWSQKTWSVGHGSE
ncbi:hypothetical protein MLD38_004031 [Melastoma candidum]|uniref:Uncharacterized protein n=1 Tax=Melastoma candidum TaxID=119954 RepID=A0ACB9S5Y6_9MYRT|nr:hypothetical protein MLD38_004031 [Melastoma candidum]